MFAIIPRDKTFFDLFDKASLIVAHAAKAYSDMLKNGLSRDHHVTGIRSLEHEADTIVGKTLEKLDRTFITPFDREDIATLMNRMDDVIDDIDAASKRLGYYGVAKATVHLINQGEVLHDSCQAVSQAVPRLRNLKRPGPLREILANIHSLEKKGDEYHQAAVAELYNGQTDPITVMKWKEIYDLTELAIDRCEDIADVMQGIVLKNT